MSEKIFTIPINEAFDARSGCPLCALHTKLEASTLSYVLGAAMMEPNVRIEMNKSGFCHSHLSMLSSMKNKLALALILESHIEETANLLNTPPSGGRRIFGGKSRIDDADISLSALADSCFICSRIRHTILRYYSNTVYLWYSDTNFREKLTYQPHICISHGAGLLKAANRELKPEFYSQFYNALTALIENGLRKLKEDVSKFCQSFDHRNAGKPMGDERNCVEKSLLLLK